jgi:hypothetical protein
MCEFILIGAKTGTLEFLREHLSNLSPMTRFIVGVSAVFVMPQLSRRLKLVMTQHYAPGMLPSQVKRAA